MTLSTPSNPYLYRFEGKIPALKNGKEVYPDWKNRKIHMSSSPEVLKWYAEQPRKLAADIEVNKKLDLIEHAFVVLDLHAPDAQYPLDTDNVYTTVQELLQPESPKEKGLLGIIKDDKFIRHHCVFTYDGPMLEGYLWVWECGMDSEVSQLLKWYHNRIDNLRRYKKQTFLPDWLA